MITAYFLSIFCFAFRVFAIDTATDHFINPGIGPGQQFKQGSILVVTFETTFENPYLSLYCSNINNPIINEKIDPPTERKFNLELDYAPQPNCYLQIQEGEGPPSQAASFGTGIFSIEKDESWKGDAKPADSCSCEAYCAAFASAQCKRTTPAQQRRGLGEFAWS